MKTDSTIATAGIALTVFGVFTVTSALAENAPPARIRGTVESIDGQDLTVTSRDGSSVKIKLAPDYLVTAVVKADMTDVSVGKYVGIAALPQLANDAEKALEVLVLPESARGSGEGHYPWDLTPESMMTNATIAAAVDQEDGRALTLKYKDGENRIIVPKDVPIVTFTPGDRSLLAPGAGILVSVVKQPDGTMTASRVVVGKDGVKPPM
jgi:outer membrane lipoprotein SlyB